MGDSYTEAFLCWASAEIADLRPPCCSDRYRSRTPAFRGRRRLWPRNVACGIPGMRYYGSDRHRRSVVRTEDLLINATEYRSLDLAQPFGLERRFDLALSLEVAEHLPAASAAGFVESLVRLAPVVLFAAAIPGQGGVMHVNEQWPGYWAALFNEHGYVAIDAIRPQIWDMDEVQWWYAQNVLLLVKSGDLADQVRRRANSIATHPVRAVVHPRLYDGLRQAHSEETLRQLCRRVPFALRRSIRWHVLRRR